MSIKDFVHYSGFRFGGGQIKYDVNDLTFLLQIPSIDSINDVDFLIIGGFTSVLFVFAYVLGALGILISARRSGDRVLRGSLKWVGIVLLLFVADLLVFASASAFNVSERDSFYSYQAIPAVLSRSLLPMFSTEAPGLQHQ